MIDVIKKAKLISEGGMSDVHIGAQEKVGEYVDNDGNLSAPKNDVLQSLAQEKANAPFPASYEIETAIKMIQDDFDDDGTPKDHYEPEPNDEQPNTIGQINQDAPAKEQFGAKMHDPQNDTLNINGMTTDEDVISMIQDTIDAGKGDDAKDYLEQFKQYLFAKSVPQTTETPVQEKTIGQGLPIGTKAFLNMGSKLDINFSRDQAYMVSGVLNRLDQDALLKAVDEYKSQELDPDQAESKELNTNTMTTEGKKQVNEAKKVDEAITMTADTPEEAGMLMQIMKLAGVHQVTPDEIGAEVPAENDADHDHDHDGQQDHAPQDCPASDDAVGSGEMGKIRDVISQNDGGEQAEETWDNEPDEKIDDVDTLVNVHSGGLNRQKQQVRKEYPGDNPLAIKEEPTEEELSNSLRTQYEGFKKSYQEAAKVTEKKGKDQDKDGDVDSKDYMKSKDIAIKKAMAKK